MESPLSKIAELELEYLVKANYLVYNQKLFKNPHLLLNLSRTDYLVFLNTNTSDLLLELFKIIIGEYLQDLEKNGAKETCIELPLLRGIILDWETEIKSD